ncbi:antitoxin family protein [Methanospirillum stamsii]|uniref:Antitoxin n=1 Tax=Methanospirillum stamsii TaxID=1277351 RepID=A0A2V2NA13_9EURY|nr:antitoxin family protein [Methanospirillum stamsii]PWR75580.1 hypothetical protein DLD82_03070 [Methanospirillum stamsii]
MSAGGLVRVLRRYHMTIHAKARYENHVLKPMQDLPLHEGEAVIIEIKRSITDQMCGLFATDPKTTEFIIDMDHSMS